MSAVKKIIAIPLGVLGALAFAKILLVIVGTLSMSIFTMLFGHGGPLFRQVLALGGGAAVLLGLVGAGLLVSAIKLFADSPRAGLSPKQPLHAGGAARSRVARPVTAPPAAPRR